MTPHENDRRRLWIDTYIAYATAATEHWETLKRGECWADMALEAFDRRFPAPRVEEPIAPVQVQSRLEEPTAGWQPTCTSPRDGTWVLLVSMHDPKSKVMRVRICRWDGKDWRTDDGHPFPANGFEPHAWMQIFPVPVPQPRIET